MSRMTYPGDILSVRVNGQRVVATRVRADEHGLTVVDPPDGWVPAEEILATAAADQCTVPDCPNPAGVPYMDVSELPTIERSWCSGHQQLVEEWRL